MPRYEYQCRSCFHQFELTQSFSSEPVATCPMCMNGARRVIHAVPVVFKGSGFYVNDYSKGGNSSGGGSQSAGSGPEKDSKAESKTESDSAKKSSSTTPKGEAKKEPASKS